MASDVKLNFCLEARFISLICIQLLPIFSVFGRGVESNLPADSIRVPILLVPCLPDVEISWS